MRDVKFKLAADPTGKVSREYGVYIEEAGIARRGRFIINPDGVIVAEEVLNPPVGRNVNELLRQLQAWKYVYEHPDEACPANMRIRCRTSLPYRVSRWNSCRKTGFFIIRIKPYNSHGSERLLQIIIAR